MQKNIVDLIIYMVKRMHIGARLKDLKLESIRGYNKSEISAAYSWLVHKQESGELNSPEAGLSYIPSPRSLFPSERSVISPEAYGYILELYYLGILNAGRFENVIEYAIMNTEGDKVEVQDIKEWIANIIFENEFSGRDQSLFLKGNETIN